MPLKFAMSDYGEQNDGDNKLWKIVVELSDLIEIADRKNWATDANDMDKRVADNAVSLIITHLQSKFSKDYPDRSQRADEVVAVPPKRSLLPESDAYEDEIFSLAPNSESWSKGIPEYMAQILSVLKKHGIQISYNNAARLLQLAIVNLGVKYFDPNIRRMIYNYYDELRRYNVTDESEWIDRYPIKIFQNLASSTSGILKVTIKDKKGLKLVAYYFDESLQSNAVKELNQIGLDIKILDYVENQLRKNFDLMGTEIDERDGYIRSLQEASEVMIN